MIIVIGEMHFIFPMIHSEVQLPIVTEFVLLHVNPSHLPASGVSSIARIAESISIATAMN
jgi:hypothetical protein